MTLGAFLFGLAIVVVAIFLLTALVGAPYVPTHARELRKIFATLRPLTSKDILVDIGSGDGVVLREALHAGAGQAVGYEINPILVLLAKVRLRKLHSHAQVKLTNFWHASFPAKTTVVYTFGESRDIDKMFKKVEQEATRLGRTIDFISYAFKVSGKKHDRQVGAHYLYKIPPLQS